MILLGEIKRRTFHTDWHDSVYIQILKLCVALEKKGILPNEIVYQKGMSEEVRSLFREHLSRLVKKKIPMHVYQRTGNFADKSLLLLDEENFQAVAQRLTGSTDVLQSPRNLNVNLWYFQQGGVKRILPVVQNKIEGYQRRAHILSDRPDIRWHLRGREQDTLLMSMAKAASIDKLTSLPTLGTFDGLMQSALRTDKKTSGAVLLLDIDDFGVLNKIYGQQAGDEVLKMVGVVLRSGIRKSDLVCRASSGADEFVVYLRNISLPLAEQVAKRLQSQLVQLGQKQRTPAFTASIGVARCDGNYGAAYRQANEALRGSKTTQGKGRVVLYRPDMHFLATAYETQKV